MPAKSEKKTALPLKHEIRVVADGEALTRAAAEEFASRTEEAVRAKGFFTVALSGGSTPKSLYHLLAHEASFRSRLPWDKIHFFWGDERHVPPDHADSNYRMVHEAMLSHAAIPPENIHRIHGEQSDATKAATDYERVLQDFFQLKAGQLPRFDLVLLGLGPDAHTASIFPGSDAVGEKARLVVANWVESFKVYRITLTAPALNHANLILFLVSGKEKAEALRAVIHGDYHPERFPAQLIRPTKGKLLWLVDRAAGRLLQAVDQ